MDSLVLTPFSRISRFTALISCDLHRAKELGMDSFRVLKTPQKKAILFIPIYILPFRDSGHETRDSGGQTHDNLPFGRVQETQL